MEPLEVAHRYFDAWNRRDPDAVQDAFVTGGTYTDPASGGALSGPAIRAYAEGLFAGFPDVVLEPVSAGTTGEGIVAVEWVMRGTHTGPFGPLPATGRSVTLPGADFIDVDGDRIRAVRGYFDQRSLMEQLGL
jgi:steroid delta-isomerase-like uncharacterized protein